MRDNRFRADPSKPVAFGRCSASPWINRAMPQSYETIFADEGGKIGASSTARSSATGF